MKDRSAADAAKWDEGYNAGLEAAIRMITPLNPHAKIPDTETRNRCVAEIQKLISAKTPPTKGQR